MPSPQHLALVGAATDPARTRRHGDEHTVAAVAAPGTAGPHRA
ncbi:hypothetical protein ACFXGI_00765 [Streptomyces sp. NPDC059355]